MSGIKESEITADDVKSAALAACEAAETGAAEARAQLAALGAAIASSATPAAFENLRTELAAALRESETAAAAARVHLANRALTLGEAQGLDHEARELRRQVDSLGVRVVASLAGVDESTRLQAIGAAVAADAARLGHWDPARLAATQAELQALSSGVVTTAGAGKVDATLKQRREAMDTDVKAFQAEAARREALDRRRQNFLAAVRSVADQKCWVSQVEQDTDPNREIRVRIDTVVHGIVLVRLPLDGGLTTESGLELVELSAAPDTATCQHWVDALQQGLLPHGWEVKLLLADGTPAARKALDRLPLPLAKRLSYGHG